jgi:phosphatidate cytidylyltransferase
MTRVLSGLALAASAFGLVWFLPTSALIGVALVVAVLAFFEYARLVRAVGAPLPVTVSLLATLGACGLAAGVYPAAFGTTALPAFGIALLAGAVSLMASGVSGAPLVHGAAAGMLAPMYLGVPLGALAAIHGAAGREGVLALVATVAASDTSQFYSGRAFGRRPLAPTISPKKTIEGAIGGFLLAPLALVAIAQWWLPRVPPLTAWAVGVGVVLAGIAGDLFESALKRAAGVKDSGTLIPGHGGVLDRIDALLFATPVFYLLVWLA